MGSAKRSLTGYGLQRISASAGISRTYQITSQEIHSQQSSGQSQETCESRDKFIGWPADTRKKNLNLIAYNSRYLILPWIQVEHLASHLLGRIAKVLPVDWERIYNHPIYFLETFVDTERFKGTCYKAANWIYLGKTTGRGKNDQTHKPNRSIKAVYGYPLSKDFRKVLCHG